MPNPIADPLVENVAEPALGELVTLEADARGVAVVTLSHPAQANAVNGAVVRGLMQAFETLHAADRVRVVFVRGAGAHFSRGLDKDWLKVAAQDWSEADLREEAEAAAKMLHAITTIPALTVALVHGEAGGLGAGLVAACDMAVASADARFDFPEVCSGAVPAIAAPYVVNAVGPRAAKGLFATGRVIGAAEALRIGLIQEVAADLAGLEAARSHLTEAALASAPDAVHAAKRLVWSVWGRSLDHALIEETAKLYAAARFSEEGREGMAAVLEARAPGWASA